jgi:hypothetical protein
MDEELKTRAFEICLEELSTGTELSEVLGLYPQWTDELRPALEAAQAARWLASAIPIPEEEQRKSRQRMVEAGLDIFRTQSKKKRPDVFRLRFVIGLFIFFLVIILGVFTVLSASARALPGESFYPFKLAVEQVRLWLTSDANQRLALEEANDAARLTEIQVLLENKENIPVDDFIEITFSGALEKLSTSDWMVADVRVLIHPDTQLVGSIDEGYVAVVKGLLKSDGSVSAQEISTRQYELKGILQRISGDTWQVGGVPFRLTARTTIQGELTEGQEGEVSLVQTEQGDFEAYLIQINQNGKEK